MAVCVCVRGGRGDGFPYVQIAMKETTRPLNLNPSQLHVSSIKIDLNLRYTCPKSLFKTLCYFFH